MTDGVQILLKIIAKNPPLCYLVEIYIINFIPSNPNFSGWGWELIILGFILQIIWLYLQYNRSR